MASRITTRVLAIDITYNGFGFVVLEHPFRLVDWGLATVSPRTESRMLARVGSMLEQYQPALVALELVKESAQRRQAHQLTQAIVAFATVKGLGVSQANRMSVAQVFGGQLSKFAIAQIIVDRFPELEWRRPRLRRPWEHEDERMQIFDAATWALCALHGRCDSPLARWHVSD